MFHRAPEAGTPALDLKVWFGVLAPSKVPSDVISRLDAEFVNALAQPDIKRHLSELGAAVIGNSPKRFADIMAADTTRLAQVVRASGAKLD